MADLESALIPRRDNLCSSSSSASGRCRRTAGLPLLLLLLVVSSLSLNLWTLVVLFSHYVTSHDMYLPAYSFDSFPLVVPDASWSFSIPPSIPSFNASLSVKNPDLLSPLDVTGAVEFPISYHGMHVGFGHMFPVSLTRHGAETATVTALVYDEYDVYEKLVEVRDGEVEFRVGFNATATVWNWLRSVGSDFFTVDCRVKVSGLREGANVTASSCHSRRIKE